MLLTETALKIFTAFKLTLYSNEISILLGEQRDKGIFNSNRVQHNGK